MPPIRCFLIEPTDRVRQKLRRYSRGDSACPTMSGSYSYHDAEMPIADAPAVFYELHPGVICNGARREDAEAYVNDPRWPAYCACGYAFTADDPRQLFCDLIYRRADTGEEMTLREAPAGAMWRAEWQRSFCCSQDDGAPLMVRLPDGTEWCVDGHANNCNWPDGDIHQDQHHCWPRRGVPPDVGVSKDYSPTCTAGAGSIASHGYHGYLREGYLADA